MDGKKNLIIGLVLMVVLAVGLFAYKKFNPEAQPAAAANGQQAPVPTPVDPYSTYNAPAK